MNLINSVRHTEQEVFVPIPLPQQEKVLQDNFLVLPLKREKPAALFNMVLLRGVGLVVVTLFAFGLLMSARTSYLYSVSSATEALQEQIVKIQVENDLLKVKVAEATSLEKITERALALGFDRPKAHQLYQMPRK